MLSLSVFPHPIRFLSSASLPVPASQPSVSSFPSLPGFALQLAFPVLRFRSRFPSFPFLSGLISHVFRPGSRTRLPVCFLSPFPDSLPQLFLRCLPPALAFRIFCFLSASFRPLLLRFRLLGLLFFLSFSSRCRLTAAFPVPRLGSRLLGFLFLSSLVSRAFLPDSCTRLYCWFPFALP